MNKEKEYRDITLPFAGESFHAPTAQECIEKMLELRALGYTFPDSAIEALKEDALEES